jgi:hypothetical protein
LDRRAKARRAGWLIGSALTVALLGANPAGAFPLLDPTNADNVPGAAPLGTELPAADVTGLRNQLGLVNPALAHVNAWTITPRLTLQELFTDNVYEVESPRRFDAATVLAPGISILADTARLRLNFDYQPTVVLHAINGNLNALAQQLNATGIVTVVPDLLFVDVTATSGVQSRYGGLVGGGTVGQGGIGLAPAGTTTGSYGAGQGLNRNNAVQTSSFAISPYILRQLGDYGSIKVGVSGNYSRYSAIEGFAASPFPTGNATNGADLFTTEEFARYTSGEFLSRFQYTLDFDAYQSKSNNYATPVVVGTTPATVPATTNTSDRLTFNNQLAYAVSHNFTLLGSAGYQEIRYSNNVAPTVNGLIWNVGFNWSPGPDSSITLTYGHINGENTVQAFGNFAITGRSSVSLSYTNSIGTQLENLQNQLNNGTIGTGGQFININTGAPLLNAQNAFAVQNGVFRYKTFSAAWTTTGVFRPASYGRSKPISRRAPDLSWSRSTRRPGPSSCCPSPTLAVRPPMSRAPRSIGSMEFHQTCR